MLEKILFKLGHLLNRVPQRWALWGCRLLGWGVYHCFWRRTRRMRRDIRLSFPQQSADWIRQFALASCQQTAEMVWLSVVLPHWSAARIAQHFRVDPAAAKHLGYLLQQDQSHLFLSPHTCLMEALCALPVLYQQHVDAQAHFPPMAVVYRPLPHAGAENWLRHTRQRFGMHLVSRKKGLREAYRVLEKKGWLGVLFDQNAGIFEPQSLLMGRPAYSSSLPDRLVSRYGSKVSILYCERTGFMQGVLKVHPLQVQPLADAPVATRQSTAGALSASPQLSGLRYPVLLAAHTWLEGWLRQNGLASAQWLWLHDRWGLKAQPHQYLGLFPCEDAKAEALAYAGLGALPRKTPIAIRLPNWLGDVVMSLPALRSIRQTRPDAAITLVGKAHFEPLLRHFALHDAYLPLPAKTKGWKACLYFWQLWQQAIWAGEPAIYINLLNSWRSDLEALCLGAPVRLGIRRGRLRWPFLTHTFDARSLPVGALCHQARVVEACFKSFGGGPSFDWSPFSLPDLPVPPHLEATVQGARHLGRVIGCIVGSENNLSRRWPISHWCAFLEQVVQQWPDVPLLLLGTSKDKPVAQAIASGVLSRFPGARVRVLAGATDLVSCAAVLTRCTVIVGGDTGGTHLASALGVPVIGLYGGGANPSVTGPVFDTSVRYLVANYKDEGYLASTATIHPHDVLDALKTLFV